MKPNSDVSDTDRLTKYDEAYLQYLSLSQIVVHSVFILVTFGTLLLWFFRHRKQNWDQRRIRTAVKYSGETRTLFTLVVLVIYIFLESAALLLSVRSSAFNWNVHVTYAVAVFGTASCIVICALSLEAISIAFHFTLLFYWLCCATLEILCLTEYIPVAQLRFADCDVRILLSSVLVFFYAALVVLEVVVLLYKVRFKISCLL